MDLNVYNRTRQNGYVNYRKDFEVIFERALKVLDMDLDKCVSVIFVLDKRMHKINKEFRNVDRTTDVISFALADDTSEGDYVSEELGDIFINIDAAKRQAIDYEHSLRREICFLFTHGILHLCGFDHMNPEDEKEMIKYQKMILDDIVSQND